MTDRYRPVSFSIETGRLSLRLRGREDAAWKHEGGTTLTLAEAQRHLAEQSVQAAIQTTSDDLQLSELRRCRRQTTAVDAICRASCRATPYG